MISLFGEDDCCLAFEKIMQKKKADLFAVCTISKKKDDSWQRGLLVYRPAKSSTLSESFEDQIWTCKCLLKSIPSNISDKTHISCAAGREGELSGTTEYIFTLDN